MKPDGKVPPFNLDAIPLWICPDLFDETKDVQYRELRIVSLYCVSMLAHELMIFGPLAIYMAFGQGNRAKGALLVWLAVGVPFGLLLGLGMWWDFHKYVKQRQNPDGADTASFPKL